MTHGDAIALIETPALRATANHPSSWADLGAGSGTFTLALADFLVAGSKIEAIDLRPAIRARKTKTGVTIQRRTADFSFPELAPQSLDGILMANSLHYVADQAAFLQTLYAALKPGGLFLLVEYDTDTPVARWVPYPVSFAAASRLFAPPVWQPLERIGSHPSAFGRSEIYAALTQIGKR